MFDAVDCRCVLGECLHCLSEIAALVAASIVAMDDDDCVSGSGAHSFDFMDGEKALTTIYLYGFLYV